MIAGTTPGSTPAKLNNSYTSAHETMRTAESAIVRSMIDKSFDPFPNPRHHSGPLMVPLGLCPRVGPTQTDVRF
jgi:hypothetical protein